MAEKKSILVPWDFTEVAENALQHAINVANAVEAEIVLINIVKSDKDIYSTSDQMKEIVSLLNNKYEFDISGVVKVGNIFSTMSKYAIEIDAFLVVMGTHGIHGMQKLTGSKALKVIEGSEIPYLVVQGEAVKKSYDTIVVPIDFKTEGREKLNWVSTIAKMFNSKVKIIAPKYSDSSIVRKANANILFAKNVLANKGILYDITIAKKKEDFHSRVIKFAEEAHTDMIIIMTTKDMNIGDFMFSANEQKIIANSSKIPVFCVNPSDKLSRSSSFWV